MRQLGARGQVKLKSSCDDQRTRNNTQTVVINMTIKRIVGKQKKTISFNSTFRMLYFCFPTMRFIVMFITAVCVLFLVKLRWPKKKSI